MQGSGPHFACPSTHRSRIVILVALLFGAPALSQQVNTLDFFVNTTPACTMPAPAACSGQTQLTGPGGTYSIITDTTTCRIPTYLWRDGGAAEPWASQTLWVRSPYLVSVGEYGYDSGGNVISDRIFRQASTMKKGSLYMPLTVDQNGTWINDPFWEEHWVDSNGHPSCSGVAVSPPPVEDFYTSFTRYRSGFMAAILDCRVPSDPACTWPSYADVIVHEDHWGGNVETYWFARWADPRSNYAYRGLGLIHWNATGPAFPTNPGWTNQTLTNAAYTWVPCSTCPDY